MAPRDGVSFRKFHGLGNDFVLVVCLDSSEPSWLSKPEAVRQICDRRHGVGADGLIFILPASSAGPTPPNDVRMVIYNADGSRPQMCGNGIRCVARLLHDEFHDRFPGPTIRIETDAGLRVCELVLKPGEQEPLVRVAMGAPEFLASTHGSLRTSARNSRASLLASEQTIEGAGRAFRGCSVSMGNPHFVIFLDDPALTPEAAARQFGPALEVHSLFPGHTNVEFVRVDSSELEVWVWERGAGLTLACGTGACAAVAAGLVTKRVPWQFPVRVNLPGGTLAITVADDFREIWMEGPAVHVFSGVYHSQP